MVFLEVGERLDSGLGDDEVRRALGAAATMRTGPPCRPPRSRFRSTPPRLLQLLDRRPLELTATVRRPLSGFEEALLSPSSRHELRSLAARAPHQTLPWLSRTVSARRGGHCARKISASKAGKA